MRAVRYDGPERFRVTDVPDLPLGTREVRLRVLASGVCGTDLFIHRHAGPGLTPGHEIVGEVIETGAEVTRLSLGDRVVVDSNRTCGECDMCQNARGSLCTAIESIGGSIPGGAAQHVIVPSAKCVPIGRLDLAAAVLAEPVACVIHGLDVLDLRPGSRVLVVGAGPTGQILTQLLAGAGASSVTVAAPSRAKLDVALSNGATAVVQTDRADFAASRDALLSDRAAGFDAVVDATGQPTVLQACLPLVRSGGTLLVYGVAPEGAAIAVEPYEILRRELTIRGSFAQVDCVARAVDMLAAGRVVPDGLITHRFGIDQYAGAIAAIPDSTCLKAVVYPNGPT